MKKGIQLFDWQKYLKSGNITSIDDDIILLERPIMESMFDYPFKVDMITAFIGLLGRIEGSINLKHYVSVAPCLTIILPGQILQHGYMSDDFTGLFISMSKKFINSLNLGSSTVLFMSISENPVVSLSEKDLQSTVTFYNMLKDTIERTDNPYRMETVKFLTMAFFFGTSYQFHKKNNDDRSKSKHEIMVDKFLGLVRQHYKHERSIGFYGDILCLTPKYLSTLIKANTGTTANDWIDRYIILEAEALLKSTNMTIQQISDDLNFPSQSFFGKYFKRHTGMSPREYRNK